MSIHASTRAAGPAHVVVIGNEKGGSGKSTIAMHVAVALLNAGQRVATIDLDSRQRSFTHYIENRRQWAKRAGLDLKVPPHFCIARGSTLRLDENEALEFEGFAEAVAAVEQSHDFVVVDTPGTDSYLMRLAHCMADTLVTPLNDSFVDFDVLASVDPVTFAVVGDSHYSQMVRDARRERRLTDGARLDWVVVRNRLSTLGTRNRRLIGEGLHDLGGRLGFRCVDGFSERLVYREFFPRGLTALDSIDEETLGVRPSLAHVTAREEVLALLDALALPLDVRERARSQARETWSSAKDKPLALLDALGD